MELRFFRCSHCGKIIVAVKDNPVPVICCGEKMQELIPGTTDAALEKHVPVLTVEGSTATVEVGSVAHPMVDVQYIECIAITAADGFAVKYLKPGDEPKAVFALSEGEKVEAVYEYCNLHGLWKA